MHLLLKDVTFLLEEAFDKAATVLRVEGAHADLPHGSGQARDTRAQDMAELREALLSGPQHELMAPSLQLLVVVASMLPGALTTPEVVVSLTSHLNAFMVKLEKGG